VLRHAAHQAQVGEQLDDVVRIEPACHSDRQRFAREFVDHAQLPELARVAGPVRDEVVGPDLIGALWPQPDARTIRCQSRSQRRDPVVAVAAVASRQLDDVSGQGPFVVRGPCDLAPRRAVLPKRPASRPLRHAKLSKRLEQGDQGWTRARLTRIVWIGLAASSVGILFSTIAMVVEVACLLINFLEAPQAGLPVIQTNLGEGAAFWISTIDMVSLMALSLAVAGEIVVLVLGLWLLYRASLRAAEPEAFGAR
jgi:Protein of unknown function (DUF3611)